MASENHSTQYYDVAKNIIFFIMAYNEVRPYCTSIGCGRDVLSPKEETFSLLGWKKFVSLQHVHNSDEMR